MAKKEFKAAVSTLSGSSFSNFLKSSKGIEVDEQYRGRFLKSKLVSLTSEPFRWVEELKYDGLVNRTTIDKAPVFIIGHWRSGTTFLHNLMSQDPQMAYVTTYHGIFPHQLLSSKWLFKNMMERKMPRRRAADNVELSPDFPQEEEFAIGNMNPYSFYHFWFFPRHTKEYCHKYILGEDMVGARRERWKKDYLKLVKKAIVNTGGERFVSKNPPHTGRIDMLLELFPDARFIYIYRNPITVFRSTMNFFTKTIPPLEFQHISDAEMQDNVLYVYEKMVKRYEETKHLVPKGQLVEIKYEEFEQDPFGHVKQIYEELNIDGFERAEENFSNYIKAQKKFKTNKHTISNETLETVEKHWGFAMQLYGYNVPADIEVLV